MISGSYYTLYRAINQALPHGVLKTTRAPSPPSTAVIEQPNAPDQPIMSTSRLGVLICTDIRFFTLNTRCFLFSCLAAMSEGIDIKVTKLLGELEQCI